MAYTITFGEYVRVILTASTCAKAIVDDFAEYGFFLNYNKVLDEILDNAIALENGARKFFVWVCPSEIRKSCEDLSEYYVRKVEMEV